MNWQTARILAKKFLVQTVIVILLLSGGMIYIFGEYKDVINYRDKLYADRQALESDRSSFALYKSDTESKLSARSAALDVREFTVTQRESANQLLTDQLNRRASEYNDAFARLKEYGEKVSVARVQHEAEMQLRQMMSDFTAMGVNLNTSIMCRDQAAETRYNIAATKMSEALALAEAYGLYQSYQEFFFRNAKTSYHTCRD